MLSESAALSEMFGGAVIVCDLHNERGHLKTATGATQAVPWNVIELLKRRGDIEHEDNASVRIWKVSQKAIERRSQPWKTAG